MSEIPQYQRLLKKAKAELLEKDYLLRRLQKQVADLEWQKAQLLKALDKAHLDDRCNKLAAEIERRESERN